MFPAPMFLIDLGGGMQGLPPRAYCAKHKQSVFVQGINNHSPSPGSMTLVYTCLLCEDEEKRARAEAEFSKGNHR